MDIEKRAEELAEQFIPVALHPELSRELATDILSLIREAVAEDRYRTLHKGLLTTDDDGGGALPPPGHILTDDGTVRKVLGDLPILASGEIVGNGATVYNAMHLGGDVMAHLVFHDGISWGHAYAPCFTISCGWNRCYSTREAAIAASTVERK